MEGSRHAFYILASYGALALAIALELVALIRRRNAARKRIQLIDIDDLS